jgi:group I intron endonuclease
MSFKYITAKIYKLTNSIDNKIYVGSTIKSLSHRLGSHRTHCRTSKSLVYDHFRAIGVENVKIELIEHYPCKSNTELRKRERYWVDLLEPELNCNKPWISSEDTRKYKREYYINS